ncbi:MAG TPA: FtsX-like permease family protein [Acidimicrobiales bacterium]|nr:FtsX-like permease family protein [Acidimicrobiales bacterium]
MIRVAWYRFAATWSRRWAGYLGVALVIGLVGGLAMGAVAGARRTQSSFPVYVASTNPPDLAGVIDFVSGLPGAAGLGYDPARVAAIEHLPHVGQISVLTGLNTIPLTSGGAPRGVQAYPAQSGEGDGSPSTAGSGLDLPSVITGRLPNPARADEFAVSPITAQMFKLQVGEVVPFGVYTNAQTLLPNFGTARVTPYRRFTATLVGVVVNSQEVIQDDIDTLNDFAFYFTPALTRPLLSCCTFYSAVGMTVTGGSRYLPAAQREVAALLPGGFNPPTAAPVAALEAKAERAIKPESIALGVFGALAALAALLIGAQLIGRQLHFAADDLGILRALGAAPAVTAADGLIGALGAVAAGSLLAVAVAVGLSPLAPLGPVRPVYPFPGVAFDWTVLGSGFAILLVGLGAVAVWLGYRITPERADRRRARAGERRSHLAASAAAAGLPAPAVTGIRFALEPGAGRNAVPVRSALLGAALAVVVVIGTVTFGASLNTLVSRPALYGWNWDYVLTAGQGNDIPGAQVRQLLDADHHVSSWSGISFDTVEIDGLTVPMIGEAPGAAVAPPLLSGHGVDGPRQVVLGAVTLAELHKHLGDSVTVHTNRLGGAKAARIVGTATLPTIGVGGNQHPEMGIGAVFDRSILPAVLSSTGGLPASEAGPNAVLVRLRDSSAAAFGSLQRIARATSNAADSGVLVLSVQRPAEIVDYRSMGTIPAFLGVGLALGAVVALGLTLVASVRRRRRELALLKTLGFTGRQLAATVAWQASVAVAIGTVVGVPLGIVVGRNLWNVFAREISVVPYPSVPVPLIVLIAVGALVLANVVAALPGWSAARTPTDLLLRAE